MSEKTKVALYARCSTSKQDLASQIEKLRQWAGQNDYEVYDLFQDFAVSGRKDSRDGINALHQEAKARKFEAVGVLELSRIGRSVPFIYNSIIHMKDNGIKYCLTNSNTALDYDTLEGRALIGGLSLAADIEWMLIQERNKRAREAIIAQNIKLGRHKKDVSLQAVRLMREKNMSMEAIAKELGVSDSTIYRRILGMKEE